MNAFAASILALSSHSVAAPANTAASTMFCRVEVYLERLEYWMEIPITEMIPTKPIDNIGKKHRNGRSESVKSD